MIGAADVRLCEKCKRGTPHNRKGACVLCGARVRKATRAARRSVVGSPLASYSLLLGVADNLWSYWLRAYWGICEVCSAPMDPDRLQCCHGYSRKDRAIRFSPDNTFSGCNSCHRRHSPPGAEWYHWMRQRYAERAALDGMNVAEAHAHAASTWARVEMASMGRGGKLTSYALQGVIADAQARIAALPAGPRKEWAQGKVERAMAKLDGRAA